MPENIYEDVNHIMELQCSEDAYVNIFANADALKYHNTNTERENSKTTKNPQVQHTGNNSTWKRCYTVTAVCVGLLCVLLLTAIIVLSIKLSKQNTEYNNQTIETNQLQTRYNNQTIETNQLQKQKDSFQKKLTSVGWTLFQSSLYYISTEMKNWTESKEDCRKRGADLVIINSKEEQTFVEEFNKKRGNYIGLSDRDKEGTFKWVDGTALNTSYWSSGNLFSDLDDCVVAGLNGSKGWFDRPCSETYYWICE
ncbi:CD209 antigen-like protein C [Tachysurus vachellii]|uniref:CD209 antigen-like protein C n=1 Tax=Tachysurus vachellii TaxID=175792 RepID=UPI00296ADF84|nr:CD209 antigen-like protein C [Tachysurus vachellii]